MKGKLGGKCDLCHARQKRVNPVQDRPPGVNWVVVQWSGRWWCGHGTVGQCWLLRLCSRIHNTQVLVMRGRSMMMECKWHHIFVVNDAMKTTGYYSNTKDVRWSKFARTGKERNAFPFKKDLSLSHFFLFFSFSKWVFPHFLIFLRLVIPFFAILFQFFIFPPF